MSALFGIMEYLGGVSGATLGYIYKNIPGAVVGWKAGRRMAGKYVRKRKASGAPAVVSNQRFKRPRVVGSFGGGRSGGTRKFSRSGGKTGKFFRKPVTRSGKRFQQFGGYSGSGVSQLSIVKPLTKKFLKGYRKVSAPRHVTGCVVDRITAPISQQANDAIEMIGLVAGQSTPHLFGHAHLQMLFDQLKVDDATGVPTTFDKTRRMFLRDCKARVRMKNQTTGQIRVTIYDVISRRDRTAEAFADDDWSIGLGDERDPISTGLPVQATPGGTPFQSERFTMFWKVVKVTNLTLHAGTEHVHSINYVVNKLINAALLEQSRMYANLTYQCLISVQGAVSNNLTDQVGLSAAALDTVVESRTRFYAMEKTRTVYTHFQNLATTGSLQQVLEDTDTVATITVA